MKFLVLGGGAQGSAAAFDLLRRSEVEQVVVGDVAADRVPGFLEPFLGQRLELAALDATKSEQVFDAMRGMDGVLCALPYYFNLEMARLAVDAGAHFCDLGGKTSIVEQQRELDGRAREREVSVVPDCGLAPGLVNVLAQAGIDALDETDSVRIRVGGLPLRPKPPLNYQIVYSLEGVLDYYTTPAVVLRDGEPREMEALGGLESVVFPKPVGELEAFYTGGGISTLPSRYRGRIREMDYKTLRYPGHAALVRGIRDLGLLGLDPVRVDGAEVVPRRVFIACAEPRLRDPAAEDLVAMRVEVSGTRAGLATTVRFELLDRYDRDHGITAMMRATGYSLALTALMQADGRIRQPGVHTPDECVPPDAFMTELGLRGLRISRTDL